MRAAWALMILAAVRCGAVSVDAPAGWSDVTASKKNPDILVSLKGPEQSSFSLTRLSPAPTERAAVRTLLLDLLAQIERKGRVQFSPPGPLESASYANGLTASWLQADARSGPGKGRVKLVLALASLRGETMVAALMSSVPETLLSPLLGSVRGSASGRAESADSQLSFALAARPLTDSERSQGLVLAVDSPDGALRIKRIDEAGADSEAESQNLVRTALAVPGVDKSSLSPVKTVATAAGPALLCVLADVKDAAGRTGLAAGFLPWGYWSYSLFAKGPGAARLLETAAGTLTAGPAADPKLLAATPRLSSSRGLGSAALWAGGLALAALALVLAKRYTRR